MILNCPHCENEFYVRDELAGETVNCHKCKMPVQAPAKPAPTSDDEGPIVTSFDFHKRAKPGMKTEAGTERQDSKVRITLGRGFRRLALVVSVMLGPISYFAFTGVGGFTANDYLVLVRSVFGFLESANEAVRAGAEFIVIWVSGFIVVWAIYWLLSFLVRGFFDTDSEKPKTSD